MSFKKPAVLFLLLSIVLLVSAALEISIGPLLIPISKILSQTLDYMYGNHGTDAVVMGAIRWPRTLTAIVIGAGLASTGAVLQAIFRNSLADPAMIGVSSGGSLGAVLTIQFGLSKFSQWCTPVGAFLSGLIVVYVIYRLSTVNKRTQTFSLLLAGVAISSFCSSIVTLLLSLAPLEAEKQILFWLMGGLDGITWNHFAMVSIFVCSGLLIYFFLSNALDILSIGEEQAEGVGVHLQKVKQAVLLTSTLVVGACVSISGVIGFVGLIVPHLLRMWIGPRHRLLVPASAFGGAILLTLSDLAARMLFQPVELNVGIVTSCLGAPFFLYLLRKQDQPINRE